MIENFWKDKYPAGIAAEINPDQYPNILSVLKESCQRFATKPAFTNLGKTLTYGELYKLSGDFAAYLQQHTDLKPGDRIAVQLPNVLQYPIVVFGAMRAGLIVVNTNPLYTARELEHQFNDSGAKAVVCLANMAHLVEGVLPKTGVKQVIVTEVGDILPPLKRFIVNFVVKHIKKMVPAYSLPQATKLTDALARGAGKSFQEAAPQADDVAVLQYTGGTTGVAKGAMLTHRNLVGTALAAAMCMAVGKLSLELCARLTWSLGCTGDLPPRGLPASSLARPAITSLTFMLVWVPLPVCQTTSGKCSSWRPARTSSAACSISRATSGGSSPRWSLTRAAAFLISARAWITASGMRWPPMAKFSSERWVWAPQ